MPWVPRELYDVMVAALLERGAVRVSAPAASPAPYTSGFVTVTPDEMEAARNAGSVAWTAPAAPTISNAVADACVRYAYGSRDEEMANRRIAYQMTQDGQSERAILATLRDGATLPAWADTL